MIKWFRTNKFRGRSRYHGRGKKAGRGAEKRGKRQRQFEQAPSHDPSEIHTETLGVCTASIETQASESYTTVSMCPNWKGCSPDEEKINLLHGYDKLLDPERSQNLHVSVEHASAKGNPKNRVCWGISDPRSR